MRSIRTMALQASWTKKVFRFSFKARTSRGPMRDKTSWFVSLWDDSDANVKGIGECGPLPGLSPDAVPEFEERLDGLLGDVRKESVSDLASLLLMIPQDMPSARFGLETAWMDLANGGRRVIFDNRFLRGETIPINGLIWMGDLNFMMSQINIKIAEGFDCIKLKVGGLDFERECDVLQYIRKRYFRQDIEIRLDANGAFKLDDALYKLTELSKFNIHSIEQPIKAGQPEMEELCRKSPIPIALDEELIGLHGSEERSALLTSLKPQYIILKPTLVGGLAACREWISIAEQQGIGWWITSALESNIGLNAICQLTAEYPVTLRQGLGTGGIYENNIPSPLRVSTGSIGRDPSGQWDIGDL